MGDSHFVIRHNENLTDEELMFLHNHDDPEYDKVYQELDESDMEENDHISEHEDIDDEIYAEDIEVIQSQQPDLLVEGNDGPFYTSKDGTQWSKLPIGKFTRRSQANVLTAAPGPTPRSLGISSIREAFLLFLSPDMLEIIVNETNRKAKHFFDDWNAANPNHFKKYAPTNRMEIEAYIGLLIILGALQSSTEPIEMLFSSDPSFCRPIIPASLSRNRYKFLTKFLRFDDFETRLQRRATDKLAPIRDIFEKLVSNCKLALNPSHHLCIDEQLVPFRGKAPFRVYMKSKPAKYGIKIWALADCKYGYTMNMQIYLGKENDRPERGQGERVVLDMIDGLGVGYGITTDNFFTSLQLADKLWEKKLTLCGTLRKNKTFIPKELLPTNTKPILSSMFAFKKNRTLVSYVPKKGRAVILLSSEHEDDKVNGEDLKCKPDIILHYNNTKGAVDTVDQMAQKYTTQRRTARWPMVIFYHMIDIAGINAYRIWMIQNPNYESGHLDARRKFLLELGKELTKENMVSRYNNSNGLQANIKENILKIVPELKVNEVILQKQPSTSQGRCFLCPRVKDRKSRQWCVKCNQFVCLQHSEKQTMCLTCKNN